MKKFFYVIAILLLIGTTQVFAEGTKQIQISCFFFQLPKKSEAGFFW